MKAVFAVLLVCIALASAQYVRVSNFEPTSGCTSLPLLNMYYLPNVCLPLSNVTSSAYWVNGTSISVWTCNNANCNASGCTEQVVSASTCYMTEMENVTTGYSLYELNVNITADFMNATMLPPSALGTLNYGPTADSCNSAPLGGAIFYSGALCSAFPANPSTFVGLQCAAGCLTATTPCSENTTTHQCECGSSGSLPLTKGCQTPSFPAWIGCGVYGQDLCASTNSSTTTGATSTSGSSTTGSATSTHTSTTGGAATTATGSGTTSATGGSTTGSSGVSVVVSVFLIAVAALFAML